MRVVLDGRTLSGHFPGIGRYAYHLAGALAERAPAAEIVLLHPPASDPRFDLRQLAGRPNLRLESLPVSVFSWRSQAAVPALLRRLHADLYHSTYALMPYLPGRPAALTLYDLIPWEQPAFLPSRRAWLAYRITTWLAVRRAGQLFAISEATAAEARRLLHPPASRLSVTPLAAEARFHRIGDRAAVARWRRAAGLPASFALWLGINKPHKNLGRLLLAWRQVLTAWPHRAGEPPCLALAGPQDPRYPLPKDEVRRLGLQGRVIVLGEVAEADLPWLYNAADLFIFPSLHEGFGLPLLEAMACGAPAACAERASLPEIAGDAARLFDPQDVDGMAAALAGLLADPDERRQRARRSLERAAQFTWARTAELTWAGYRRLLGLEGSH